MKTTVKLSEVIKVHHGWPFKSEHFTDDTTDKPIVVNIGNFQYDGGFRFETTRKKGYSGTYPKEYELSPNDILLVMTCQTAGGEILGIPGRIPNDGRVYLHNQRLGKVEILRPDLVDDNYLYWLFLSKDFNKHLYNTASGTKILHTAPSRIESYEIDLPLLEIQRRIGEILNSLDEKISLNRRMNETLEQMAMALYKHWFIDFGPFQDSMEGDVPSGWKNTTLGEIANIFMGQSPKSSFYNHEQEGLPFHQGVSNFGERFPDHDVYSSQILKRASQGDILVSVRAPVGRINIADRDIVIGRGLSSFRHKNEKMSFLLYTLKNIFAVEDSIGSGTVFNSVSKSDLEKITVILPPDHVIDEFENKVKEFDSLILSNTIEIRSLTESRDYLLPHLLSGEIEVKAAEEQVEEVLVGG